MKKIQLVLGFILISVLTFAQDVVILKHTNYTSHFSKTKHYPVLVEWVLTKSMVSCRTPLKRKNNFKPDPQLSVETNISSDYIKSGYDRGHVMPAADNLCQTPQIQDESFYYSNILPQPYNLNRGDWKSLEVATRNWVLISGNIKVWSGGIGETKKIGVISVPEKCWKVVYFESSNRYVAFLFNNDSSKPDGFTNNEVPLNELESLTGFTFK